VVLNYKTDEVEIVSYPIIENLKVFFVNLINRTTHLHKEIEICYLIDGKMRITTPSSTYIAEKGSLLLFNSNEPHSLSRIEGSSTILSIQISPDILKQVFPEISNIIFLDTLILKEDSETNRSILFSEIYHTAKEYYDKTYGAELSLFSHVLSIFYQLIKITKYRKIDHEEYNRRVNKRIRINRITNYIHENISSRITLTDIANQEGISTNYISHFFRENLNITFQEYLSDIRFEKALKLITSTNLRIIDISLECGFSDCKYLNKAFIRNCGVLPKDYRKNFKNQRTRSDKRYRGLSPETTQYLYHDKRDISLLLQQLETVKTKDLD
jgi:AraC-like DNA-binding protein